MYVPHLLYPFIHLWTLTLLQYFLCPTWVQGICYFLHIWNSSVFSYMKKFRILLSWGGGWKCLYPPLKVFIILKSLPSYLKELRNTISANINTGTFAHCWEYNGIPGWVSGKDSFCQCRCGLSPWVEKIPSRRKWQLNSNILAWEVPWTREAWQSTAHGVTKSRTWLSD